MKRALLLLVSLSLPALVCGQDAKSDAEKIAGTWVVKSALIDGAKPDDATWNGIATTKFIFAADGRVTYTSAKGEDRASFKIDPTKTPRAIDMFNSTGQLNSVGVYECSGDTLKIAFHRDKEKRPKAVGSEKGSGVSLLIFERAKP